jgi:hypothetical protein
VAVLTLREISVKFDFLAKMGVYFTLFPWIRLGPTYDYDVLKVVQFILLCLCTYMAIHSAASSLCKRCSQSHLSSSAVNLINYLLCESHLTDFHNNIIINNYKVLNYILAAL